MAVLAKILLEEPPRVRELRADVPAALDELVARMLAKEPRGAPRRRRGGRRARSPRCAPLADAAAAPRAGGRARSAAASGACCRGPGARRATATRDEIARRRRRARRPRRAHRRRSAAWSTLVRRRRARPISVRAGGALRARAARARCRRRRWSALADRARGRRRRAPAARRGHRARGRAPGGAPIARPTRRRGRARSADQPASAIERRRRTPTNARRRRGPHRRGHRGPARRALRRRRRRRRASALRGERDRWSTPRARCSASPRRASGASASSARSTRSSTSASTSRGARACSSPAPAGRRQVAPALRAPARARAPRAEPLEVWIGRGDPMTAGSPFGAARAASSAAPPASSTASRSACASSKLRARVARHGARRPTLGARRARSSASSSARPFPDDDDVQLRAARHDPMLMGDQMRRAWEDCARAPSARAQPVVLVLEDLHWGDLPTVRFVDAALRNLRDRPLIVLALARPEVHELFPRLWAERGVHRDPPRRARRARPPSGSCAQVLGDDVDAADVVARIVERAARQRVLPRGADPRRRRGQGRRAARDGARDGAGAPRARSTPAARRVLRAASVFGAGVLARRACAALLGGSTATRGVDAWLAELVEREVIVPRAGAEFPGEERVRLPPRARARGGVRDAHRRRSRARPPARRRVARAARRARRDGARRALRARRRARARAVGWYRRAAEQALDGDDLRRRCSRAPSAASRAAPRGEALGALRARRGRGARWRGEFADAGARRAPTHALAAAAATALWFAAAGELASAAGVQGQGERARRDLRASSTSSCTRRRRAGRAAPMPAPRSDGRDRSPPPAVEQLFIRRDRSADAL